ncbi:hypothetical protein OESDEN_07418 [Oesophagostomum dentatum]|uniref:BTB domain-containing protein n=1 Tax=Oesophagostomum dentatum TaxID=61180 RepID=A0A0B1T648_OESDE|nr:hypothetical protein OESDEN_07418 [Oesophagostomum dentatum]
MGTEILPEVCFSPAPSSFDRPFRIHVQDRVFLIDAESMRKISPVFSVMCYGKDFEGGRELSREIVDEKCDDIDIFLRAVHDNSVINDMGTEILPEVCFSPAPSSFDRPFRIHVQDRVFLIDAESMRKISPVFSVMCYGKDFEGGRELSREIVDEKCDDIDIFLRAVHDNSVINGRFKNG